MPSREELGEFFDALNTARNLASPNEWACVETSRKILEHFNRGHMAGIEEAGYFIYENVKVFETGKRESAQKKEAMNIEEAVFGKKS